jgi:hypothetical protein
MLASTMPHSITELCADAVPAKDSRRGVANQCFFRHCRVFDKAPISGLDGDNHVGRRIDSSELQLALTCCLT